MRQSRERLIREFHAGQIYGAIFENRVVRDGRTWSEYAVRILRRFKNQRTGGLSSSTFFRIQDLPNLAAVASRAFQYISLSEYRNGVSHVCVRYLLLKLGVSHELTVYVRHRHRCHRS